VNYSAEKSGVTKAKNVGGWSARIVVAFVGYIWPSWFGLGATKLIQLGYALAVLWVTLFLPGILLLLLRWSFGLLTVILAGGLVYIVGRHTPVSAQIVGAYAIAWLFLLSAVRGIFVRGTRSGDGGDLSQLTLIPRFIWPGGIAGTTTHSDALPDGGMTGRSRAGRRAHARFRGNGL